MLVTAAVDAGRKRRVPSAPLEAESLPSPVDLALEAVASRTALLACVCQLPAGQRAVLVLRYFNDLTEAETARELGCSIGAVKSQHARAMARLRELVPNDRTTA
jgi:RNA polymerase sigma factor (sigma-70 family)